MLEKPPPKKRWILKTAICGAVVYTSLAFIGVICMMVDGTGKFYSVLFAFTLPLLGVLIPFDFLNQAVLNWVMFISPAILGALVFVGTRLLWNSIKTRSAHLAPQKKSVVNFVTVICLALVIGSPVLLQKTSIPLSFKNKKIGLMKNSLLPFDKTRVFIGNKKVFSLYNGSACEYPMMIHPLDEGTRILCVCANDVEELVFVVDLNGSKTDTSTNLFWAPYLVTDTDALVRLPTKTERDESLDWLEKASDREYRNMSLPFNDFGLFRIYTGKNEAHFLLSNAPLNGSGGQAMIYDMPPDVEVLGL